MDQFKVSRAISPEKLSYAGFVVDTIKDKALLKHYYLYRKIVGDTHLRVKITQVGKKFYYSNKNGSTLYIGNGLRYESRPADVEKMTSIGFSPIIKDYKEKMYELMDEGILTKKLKPKKKNH